jgi:hypothetical protein
MRKLTCFLLLCVVAGCENYQVPQANCFSFVSRGPAPIDCNFEALGSPDPEDIANE